MKKILFISALCVSVLSPFFLSAAEIRMIWWTGTPQSEEMRKDADSFVGYLNKRLGENQITYRIVGFGEDPNDLVREYNPQLGIISRTYWRTYQKEAQNGMEWLSIRHQKQKKPDYMQMGSIPFIPDIVAENLLKNMEPKEEARGERKLGFFEVLKKGMQPQAIKMPIVGRPDANLALPIKDFIGFFDIFTGGARRGSSSQSNWDSVVLFDSDMPELGAIEDALLQMNMDPEGRAILDTLQLENFSRRLK